MSKKAKAKPQARPAEASRLAGVADHPRAAAAVARAKSLGGLAGFVLIGAASVVHGEPLLGSLVRASVAGVVCYLVVWAAAVAVWRQLLVAELRGAYRRRQGDEA